MALPRTSSMLHPERQPQPKLPGWPIRAHQALFAVLILVPAFAFSGYLIARSHSQQLAQAEARVAQLASDLADDISDELEQSVTILETLALSGSFQRGDYASLHAQAKRVLGARGDNFLLLDGAGQQLVNAYVPWGTPLPKTGDPQSLTSAVETGKPYVSELFVGKVTGRWVVDILYPVLRNGAEPRVLVLSLSADRIRRKLADQRIEPGWMTAVADRQGRLIARLLDHEQYVGRRLPGEMLGVGTEARRAYRVAGMDGRPTVRAVAPTRLGGWTVAASVAEAGLNASAYQAMRELTLAGLGLLLLSGLLVAWQSERIAGSIRSLAGAHPEGAAPWQPKPVREVNEAAALLASANAELAVTTAALRQRDETLRMALSAANAAAFVWDIEKNEVRRLFRAGAMEVGPDRPPDTFEEVLGAVHPADQAQFKAAVDAALASADQPYRGSYRQALPGGTVRWIEEWGKVERRADGGAARLIGISLDVTERRAAELALQRSDERMRLASEAAGFGTYHYDAVTADNEWSSQAKLIAGIAPDTVMSLDRVHAAIHPDDRARVAAAMQHGLAPGGPDEFDDEHRLVRPGGDVRWVHVKGRTYRDAEGRTLRAAGTIVDVTASKATAEALARSEQRFRELADSMPQLVWIADDRGQVTYYNKRREEYRTSPRDRKEWQAIVHPDDLPRTRHAWRQAVVAGASYECEHRVQRADGSFRWQLSRARPVAQDGGVVWYGTATDIHDLKEREERIRLLMREVNHRAKNLLAVVLSLARQSSRSDSPSEFVERLARRIHGLAASQDLLVKSEWRGVALADLVSAQLAPFGELVDGRTTFGGPPLVITANAAQVLGMALHELVVNAIKFGSLSGQGGRLEIAWQLDGEGPAASFTLTWREREGPEVHAPEHRGFGDVVLGRIVEQSLSARANLDYAPAGLGWTLVAPLAQIVETGAGLEPGVPSR